MSSIPDVINCVSHLAEYCGETDRSLRKLLNAQRAWRNFERGMSCLRLGTLPEKTLSGNTAAVGRSHEAFVYPFSQTVEFDGDGLTFIIKSLTIDILVILSLAQIRYNY